MIVDVNGRVLGPVLTFEASQSGDTYGTILYVDDEPVVLFLSRSQIAASSTRLIFESSDCSGPGFLMLSVLPNEWESRRAFAIDQPSGLTLWVAAADFLRRPIFGSEMFGDGSCVARPLPVQLGRITLLAVEVATGFVGPFSVERDGSSLLGSAASIPAVGPIGLTVLIGLIAGSAYWLMRR